MKQLTGNCKTHALRSTNEKHSKKQFKQSDIARVFYNSGMENGTNRHDKMCARLEDAYFTSEAPFAKHSLNIPSITFPVYWYYKCQCQSATPSYIYHLMSNYRGITQRSGGIGRNIDSFPTISSPFVSFMGFFVA